MTDTPAIFVGTVTTTGRSSALLLEKPFFRANPEFRQKAKVTAHVVGPGFVLVGVDAEAGEGADDGRDPIATAYLAFLERDMVDHPSRLVPFAPDTVAKLDSLLQGVAVDPNATLPDDVAF